MDIKSLVLRFAPEFLLWRMKGRHYARLLEDLPADEEKEFLPIPVLLKPGDVAVDVGANFGIYTRLFSNLVGDEGEVHSFEPVPHTYKVLRSCVGRLGMRNVKTYPCALSDRRGETVMKFPPYERGGTNYYKAFIAEGAKAARPGRKRSVKLRTMDEALDKVDRPIRFVKIDVEGHELPVIRGGEAILDRWRPALLIEVSRNPDEPGSPSADLFRILEAHEYAPYHLTADGLRRRTHGVRSVNYFFLTNHQSRSLEKAGLLVHV